MRLLSTLAAICFIQATTASEEIFLSEVADNEEAAPQAEDPTPAAQSEETPVAEEEPTLSEEKPESGGEELVPPFTGQWYLCVAVALFCTLWGGLMSGLTVGLLSIDELELELTRTIGDGAEQARVSNTPINDILQAEKLLGILGKHHWLLVTLLLCNALALESLPIFLDRIVPSHVAILLSVTAVLIGGEVVPQAICIGPQQLAIAEAATPLVNCLCYATFPVSWPLAKVLDALLGEHKLTRFTNDQLKGLVKLHCQEYMKECTKETDGVEGLDNIQAKVIENAIMAKATSAGEIEKSIAEIYTLSWDEPMTAEKIEEIADVCYSRIPVYHGPKERNFIVGVLMLKSLVRFSFDASDVRTVGELAVAGKVEIRDPIYVSRDAPIFTVMREFQRGSLHQAVVCEETSHHGAEFDAFVRMLREKRRGANATVQDDG